MTVTEAIPATLESVHTVAEHILAAARHRATGRIGLTVIDGGFATPPFGPDSTVVGLVDGSIVVRAGESERRAPLTTLRAAGEFVGVEPGSPADVYTPATACDLDAQLRMEPNSLQRLVDWYGMCAEALRRFAVEIADDQPSNITLWPEHFDVAIRVGEVNYGALGGDANIPEPYAYVGPTGEAHPTEPAAFWNKPFGAVRTWRQLRSADDVLAFYREGRGYF